MHHKSENKTHKVQSERGKPETGQEIQIFGEYSNNDAKCHNEIQRRIVLGKQAFTARDELPKNGLKKEIRKILVTALVWCMIPCMDQKY